MCASFEIFIVVFLRIKVFRDVTLSKNTLQFSS
jgi:hypothetical protein